MACHEWMLGELTRNLLHNTIKYTPHGGALSVRVQVSGDDAVLSISDSGPGVTDEFAKRLFQPFSAGRSGTRGSGLCLAICFEITQALGHDHFDDPPRQLGCQPTRHSSGPRTGRRGASPAGLFVGSCLKFGREATADGC